MNYILLCISITSMVLQNGLFNTLGKKYLKEKGDVYLFNSINYLFCFFMFFILMLKSGISPYSFLLGILFGIITAFCNTYKMLALSKGPMHITILITTSSMIIPALSGFFMFGEPISLPKLIFVGILIFFIYLSPDKKSDGIINKKWFFYSLITFILMGIIGIMQKVHQNSSYKNELSGFLASAFFVSILFSLYLAKRNKRSVNFRKKHYLLALVCGICTFLMNFLNLKLSGLLPSQLFFPLVNGGAIVITSFVSFILFKEKLSRLQLIGLTGGIASLILICIIK